MNINVGKYYLDKEQTKIVLDSSEQVPARP